MPHLNFYNIYRNLTDLDNNTTLEMQHVFRLPEGYCKKAPIKSNTESLVSIGADKKVFLVDPYTDNEILVEHGGTSIVTPDNSEGEGIPTHFLNI